MECALERGDNYNFLLIGSHLCEFNDIGEKLSFVNANHLKLAPRVFQLAKGGRRDGFALDATVGRDGVLVIVALVGRELDSEYFLACDLMFAAPSQKLSALAREHAAHD